MHMSIVPNPAEMPQNQDVAAPSTTPDLTLALSSNFDAICQPWRNLEHRAVGHVFQTWAWVSNWHKYIGQTRNIQPMIVTASSRDGVLRALLPMGIETRLGIRTLVWLGAEHADYKGPLLDPVLLSQLDEETTRSFFGTAFRLIPGVDEVRLVDMPAELGIGPHPLRAFSNQMSPVSSHALTLTSDFDALYKARRGSSSRKKLRQKLRRLETATGPASLRIAKTSPQRAAAITHLIDQKRTRLEEKGVGDMFAEPGVRAFYRAMAEQHPQICQLSTYQAGEETVGTNWGLVWRDRYYYVLSTMTDGEHRVHSPGQLHLNTLIDWSVAQGLKTFDFTAGDEAYKDDWCDTSTPLFDVHLGLTIKGKVTAGIHRTARTLKRQIKHSDLMWDRVQRGRKSLKKLRTTTGW